MSSSSALVPQRREGRELSVQAILHSQVSESVEDDDEEMMSSQEDLFDGEKNGKTQRFFQIQIYFLVITLISPRQKELPGSKNEMLILVTGSTSAWFLNS